MGTFLPTLRMLTNSHVRVAGSLELGQDLISPAVDAACVTLAGCPILEARAEIFGLLRHHLDDPNSGSCIGEGDLPFCCRRWQEGLLAGIRARAGQRHRALRGIGRERTPHQKAEQASRGSGRYKKGSRGDGDLSIAHGATQ